MLLREWKTRERSKRWRFFSKSWRLCSTLAIKSCITNCYATNHFLECWASWNVLSPFNIDDPNFRNKRTKHRDFMMGECKLMEVVPFKSNPELLNLVVFTYRLEYVRECVLFPYLDDNGFGSSGCVSSCTISDHTQQLQKNFQPSLQPETQRIHQLSLWSASSTGPRVL